MVDEEYAIPGMVLRHFDLSSSPYDEARVGSIQTRRSRYPDGQLFIDRLLNLAGIDGSSLYPPTTPAGYRRLLASIHISELDRLKKDCLYYYLLNDYRPQENSSDRASGFARKRCLSKTWKGFMDGYWNLDNGQFEAGITNLTNPAITEVNFPSAVIHTLATLAEPPSLACSSIHTFLLTRIPTDQTPQVDIEIYTTVLASVSSVPSDFSYIRSLSPDAQGRLREVVWSWALGAPKAPCGSGGAGIVQQKAIKEILHLPLRPEEDDHLLAFLLAPPKTITPKALSLLHDLVTLRLIHQGKYAESLQLDKELAGSGGKEDDRQRRREMVREFIAILPEAQRRALAVDSQMNVDRRGKELVNGNGGMDVDVDAPASGMDHEGMDVSQEYQNSTPAVPAFPLDPPTLSTTATHPKPRLPSTITTIARPGSPALAPGSRVVSTSTHSPFSGPPRFATNPNLPSTSSPHGSGAGTPLKRVLSGSPFTLPMSKGANAVRSAGISQTPTRQMRELPIPRPKPRPEISDEHEGEGEGEGGEEKKKSQKLSRSRAVSQRTQARAESEDMAVDQQEGEEEDSKDQTEAELSTPHPETEPRQEMEVEQEKEATTEPEAEPEPEPVPEPTPRIRRSKRMPTTSPPTQAPPAAPQRRSSRQTTAPPPISPAHRIPGTFEPVPEDRPLEPTQGISRSRTRRQLSAAPSEPSEPQGPGRSRMTRSASRATLGDPSEEEPRAPKRSRRLSAASEMSEMTTTPTPGPTPRRTRGKKDAGGGGGGGESQRGSPTPSVAASVGARSRRGASATPRKSTRAKK